VLLQADFGIAQGQKPPFFPTYLLEGRKESYFRGIAEWTLRLGGVSDTFHPQARGRGKELGRAPIQPAGSQVSLCIFRVLGSWVGHSSDRSGVAVQDAWASLGVGYTVPALQMGRVCPMALATT
jgi:hypothetical protein